MDGEVDATNPCESDDCGESCESEESGSDVTDDPQLGAFVTRSDGTGGYIVKVCRGTGSDEKFYMVRWNGSRDLDPLDVQYARDRDFHIEYPEAGGPDRPWRDRESTRAVTPPREQWWRTYTDPQGNVYTRRFKQGPQSGTWTPKGPHYWENKKKKARKVERLKKFATEDAQDPRGADRRERRRQEQRLYEHAIHKQRQAYVAALDGGAAAAAPAGAAPVPWRSRDSRGRGRGHVSTRGGSRPSHSDGRWSSYHYSEWHWHPHQWGTR